MKSIINVLLISVVMLQLCECGSLISLWETSCKLHADTKHEELKGIIKDQHNFNSNNWVHSTLAVLTIIISSIIIIACCYVCVKLGPLWSMFGCVRNWTQPQPQLQPATNQQIYSPPFNSNVFAGRTLQFKEILPNQQPINNQFN